jgi:hypothetical protein
MRTGTLVDRCDHCGHLLVRMNPGQHAAVEAIYEDISAQLDFPAGSGHMLDPDEWHQIMVAAFAKEKGWKPKILPALDGDGFVMVMRTKQSRLTKRQGSELIEFARAYSVNRGAVLREWDEDGNLVSGAPLNALAKAA